MKNNVRILCDFVYWSILLILPNEEYLSKPLILSKIFVQIK